MLGPVFLLLTSLMIGYIYKVQNNKDRVTLVTRTILELISLTQKVAGRSVSIRGFTSTELRRLEGFLINSDSLSEQDNRIKIHLLKKISKILWHESKHNHRLLRCLLRNPVPISMTDKVRVLKILSFNRYMLKKLTILENFGPEYYQHIYHRDRVGDIYQAIIDTGEDIVTNPIISGNRPDLIAFGSFEKSNLFESPMPQLSHSHFSQKEFISVGDLSPDGIDCVATTLFPVCDPNGVEVSFYWFNHASELPVLISVLSHS